MPRLTSGRAVYLAVDLVLLVVCSLHLPSLLDKPTPPFSADLRNGQVIVRHITSAPEAGGLEEGDRILSWEGIEPRIPLTLDYLADFQTVGAAVNVRYIRSAETGQPRTTVVTLVQAFAPRDVGVYYLVGIVCWVLAVILVVRGPAGPATHVLHWSMVSLGGAVILAWEGIDPQGILPLYLSSFLFFLLYAVVAATFLAFTLLFPRKGPRLSASVLAALSMPAFFPLIPIFLHHRRAVLDRSLDDYVSFQTWFDVFHVVVLLYVLAGMVSFVRSYVRAATSVEKRKLLWILFGLCVGPTPFLVFTIIPNLVAPSWTVPESVSLAFMVLIPLSFVVSIVRYQILDVTVVIKRTTAYALVVTLLLLLYVGLVGFMAYLVGRYTLEQMAVGAMLVAVLFEPARRRVEHLVDRRFFRVTYDFRQAVSSFVQRIKICVDEKSLARELVEETDRLIPVQRIGFFGLTRPANRLRCIAHRDFDLLERRGVTFQPEQLKTGLEQPVARTECVEPGVPHEPADSRVFGRWGMAVVFPLHAGTGEILGFLVLGEKRSGARFTVEDIDLLTNVTTQAGLEIERIRLQRDLMLEHAEAEQLRALNEMKTDFVHYVTHEFRNPLANIRMYGEFLRDRGRGLDSRSREWLGVIQGERERLDSMVDTILNSARIDHGAKEYLRARADLGAIVDSVMERMSYQLKKHRFKVAYRRRKSALAVLVDAGAVELAITNLVGNAIKYSGETKYLRVKVARQGAWAVVTVEDRGRGISPEALPRLFEKFYRDPSHRVEVKGFGLGLPLVKHVMDGHGGEVDVHSTPGKGSVFTLRFPPAGPHHARSKKNPGG